VCASIATHFSMDYYINREGIRALSIGKNTNNLEISKFVN